jgi:hypothetical protein
VHIHDDRCLLEDDADYGKNTFLDAGGMVLHFNSIQTWHDHDRRDDT